MRTSSLLGLALLTTLAGCAPAWDRSAIATQPVGPPECGSFFGWALLVNGVLWSTESEEEMREWVSRIDSADVLSRTNLVPNEGSAIFGRQGAQGGVMVTLRRGSPTERRFGVPPAPRADRTYCPRHGIHTPAAPPADTAQASPPQRSAGPGRGSDDGPRSTRGQPST